MPSDDPREQVKSLLLDHRGAGNPITSRKINEKIQQDAIGSFPGTRALIREIMVEEQIPVIGGSNGYYVAETEEEIQEYIDTLEKRIMGITERRYAIKRAAELWDGEIEEDDDLDIL
jgi:ABC-type uncharacterized transport system ATPase subunit